MTTAMFYVKNHQRHIEIDWAIFSQMWPLSRKKQSDFVANTTTGHTFALSLSYFSVYFHYTTDYG